MFNKYLGFSTDPNENLGASYAECEAKYLELLPLVKAYHDQHPENDNARKALTALTQALNPERIPQERIVAEVAQTPVRPASPSSLSASSAMFSRLVAESVHEIEVTYKQDPPKVFLCPINQTIMKDPVMTTTGQSYEREAITTWINMQHTEPQSKATQEISDLRPNLALKEMIETWKNENKIEQMLNSHQKVLR